MKRFVILALLFGCSLAAPTSTSREDPDDEKLVVTEEFFVEPFKVHTAEHEIVSLLVPLNSLNFEDDEDDEDTDTDDDRPGAESTVFFVEADIKDGVKEYKGLSVIKDKQVKKILETGTDAAAANEDTKTVYFGATDGLYIYNDKENSAEKFGSITDSIIGIAKVNGTDMLYILTDKNELFKVTEQGTKKEKVDDVVGAQQIVLDYSNNLYYYTADKQAFVIHENGAKKFEDLPANPSYINLLKPPFIIEDGVPIIIDNKAYIIYANGTSELTDFEFAVRPSAYAMEGTLIQYYAYNKGIYEYNVLVLLIGGLLEELKTFLNEKSDEIQSIATRSRSDLVS